MVTSHSMPFIPDLKKIGNLIHMILIFTLNIPSELMFSWDELGGEKEEVYFSLLCVYYELRGHTGLLDKCFTQKSNFSSRVFCEEGIQQSA